MDQNLEWESVRYFKEATTLLVLFVPLAWTALSGCSTMKSVLGANHASDETIPIQNPFGDFHRAENAKYQNIVLRTKKGDRSLEIELPKQDQRITDFVIPLSPEFVNEGRALAGTAVQTDIDTSYLEKKPGMTDREIMHGFPQGSADVQAERDKIEAGLGLAPSTEDTEFSDASYLAQLDKVKQLYGLKRYEAALLEIDSLLRTYPTDPRLYEMKGTLLSRLGYEELAIKSWEQSLELRPTNGPLKKFIDRRKEIANLRRPAGR